MLPIPVNYSKSWSYELWESWVWKAQPYFHSYFFSHCGEKKRAKTSGERILYFKNAGYSFLVIWMFSSLILNFQAVENCLGEMLSSPSVCGCNMTPLVQMLILAQETKKGIELLWQGTACFKGCFENTFWKNSGRRNVTLLREIVVMKSLNLFRRRNILGILHWNTL